MKNSKVYAVLLSFALCIGLLPSDAAAASADVKLAKASVKLTISKEGGKTTYGTAKIKVNAKKGIKVKKATYKSKNKKIATVDKKGKVKAKKAGKTSIKVTVKYMDKRKTTKKTLTLKVTVTKKDVENKAAVSSPTLKPTDNVSVTPTPTQPPSENDVTPSQTETVNGMTIQDNILIDGKNATGNVTIPEGVTGIAQEAFKGADITGVTFPTTLQYIGQYAFLGCSKLTEIHIPQGVSTVAIGAFENCTALKKVTILNKNVMFVLLFTGCESLEELTTPVDKSTCKHDGYIRIALVESSTTDMVYSVAICGECGNIRKLPLMI